MKIGDVTIPQISAELLDRNETLSFQCGLGLGGDYILHADRQRVVVKDGKILDTGETQGEMRYSVTRRLSEIVAKTVTLDDGTTLNGAQIAEAVEKLSNILAREEVPLP